MTAIAQQKPAEMLILLIELKPSLWKRYNIVSPSKVGWIAKMLPFTTDGLATANAIIERRKPLSAHVMKTTEHFDLASDLLIHAMMQVQLGKGRKLI